MDYSIVIPAYNEEKIIEKTIRVVLEEIEKYSLSYEIIVVDDGSTDSTKTILIRLAKEIPKLKVISYFPNIGLGYAQQRLYEAAVGDVIIHLDADLSMKPLHLFPLFIQELKLGADVVVGSKYIMQERTVPFTRLIPSRIFYYWNRLLFGFKVKDYGSGFFAIKKEFLKKLNLYSRGWEVHTEFYAKLHKLNAKIIEVHSYYIHRDNGRFSVLRDGFKIVLNSLKIKTILLSKAEEKKK